MHPRSSQKFSGSCDRLLFNHFNPAESRPEQKQWTVHTKNKTKTSDETGRILSTLWELNKSTCVWVLIVSTELSLSQVEWKEWKSKPKMPLNFYPPKFLSIHCVNINRHTGTDADSETQKQKKMCVIWNLHLDKRILGHQQQLPL